MGPTPLEQQIPVKILPSFAGGKKNNGNVQDFLVVHLNFLHSMCNHLWENLLQYSLVSFATCYQSIQLK